MLEELLTLNVFNFLLVFTRIGTALMLLPGFSAAYVSARVRLVLGMAVALVVTPAVAAGLPAMPTAPAALTLLLVKEGLIGAFFGTLGRIILAAMHVAGTVISFTSSMANAFVNDPISEEQGSIVSNFLVLVATVLIFVTDLHHLMLAAVIESYELFVPGAALSIGDMAEVLVRRNSEAFSLGIRLAGPFLVVGIAYNLGMGLMSRLQPQLPIFFVGMPAQIGISFFLMMVVLSGMMVAFLPHFQAAFEVFVTL